MSTNQPYLREEYIARLNRVIDSAIGYLFTAYCSLLTVHCLLPAWLVTAG